MAYLRWVAIYLFLQYDPPLLSTMEYAPYLSTIGVERWGSMAAHRR